MGKVGDLIVRLKLKHEDYQKGLKKAETSTNKFGNSFKKVKGVALGVWAAIGAAVIKVAKDIVQSSNTMADKWEMFTSKAKAGWNAFVRTLANGDWTNFVHNFKEATTAAEYFMSAMQGDTHASNSIKIQKAAMAEELAQLRIIMQDVTKTQKERLKAADDYLNKVKPIYTQEMTRLQELQKAHMAVLGAGHYSVEQMISPQMMADVKQFLVLYGQSKKYEELNGMTLREAVDIAKFEITYTNQFSAKAQLATDMRERLADLSKSLFPKQDTTFLFRLAENYENSFTPEQVKELVAAIVAYEEAKAAFNAETREIQTQKNNIKKSAGTEPTAEDLKALKDSLYQIKEIEAITSSATLQFDIPDIIPDDWLTRNREKIDQALAEAERLKAITEQINKSINDAVIQSLSGATQAFTDCVAGIEGADASQVLAALLEPFASTAISLGEMLLAEGLGIEVFKESLKSLNGTAAIAAGASLIALGSALSSGIRALGSGASESATSAGYDSSSSSDNIERYEQEITVHVVGEISGDKIILAGQKTLNKWNR